MDDSKLLQEFAKTLKFIPCILHNTTSITESESGITTQLSISCSDCDVESDGPADNFVERYEYLLGVADCRHLYLSALARHIRHSGDVQGLWLKDWWTAEVASCFQSSSRRVRVAACQVLIAVFTHKMFKGLGDEARAVFEGNVEFLWVVYENFYKGLDEGVDCADTVISALGEIGRYAKYSLNNEFS
jgi:hypothetical protein